jgi:hypothetical protein
MSDMRKVTPIDHSPYRFGGEADLLSGFGYRVG